METSERQRFLCSLFPNLLDMRIPYWEGRSTTRLRILEMDCLERGGKPTAALDFLYDLHQLEI